MVDETGLSVANVKAGYGRAVVLHGVSLSVQPGQIVCVLGANGAGKSTLVRTIAGLLPVRSGSVRVDGVDVTRSRPERRASNGVILVPEGRQLFATMTVAENIEAGACAAKGRQDSKELVDDLIDVFPVIRERWTQTAGLLSGGEQQMVALCRAAASAPRYLLLDEPSLGLSPLLCEEVFSFIEAVADVTGAGIVLVEQLADRALQLASHAYVLERGEVVLEDRAERVAASDSVRAAYLGEAQFETIQEDQHAT